MMAQSTAAPSGQAGLARAALPVGPQMAYGAGQIAGQVFRDVPSLLLLFFMTNALGIPPGLAGIAIFVPKLVWGLVCDISVGVASDRLARRVARRWWLLAGAAGVPVAMILLFDVPSFGTGGRALYVASVFSLYMLVFGIFSVPYLAIAGELSADPHQRTVIMAWRLVFTAIGVLVADSLAPVFIQSQGGGQPAYLRAAMLLSAVCSVALVVAWFGANALARGSAPAVRPRITARDALSALAGRRFSVLLGANLFLLVGGGMGYAAMLYFLTYNLHRADAFRQIGLITLIASAAIIAAQPLWVFLARKWGKKATYVAAALFYGATMAGWGVLGPLGIGVSYGFAVLLGVSNSGWTLLGYSMVADLAGEGHAGLYSAVWIAADKIGFALGGTLLVGAVLSGFGFDAPRAMAGLPQSAAALHGVLLAFAILPGCLSAAGAAVFGRWGKEGLLS